MDYKLVVTRDAEEDLERFIKPSGFIGKIVTWAMNRANIVMYRGIITKMKPHDSMRILDIGFGNGYLEKLIYLIDYLRVSDD